MALAIAGFDAEAFREGIRIPMRMGLPVDPNLWPEFVTERAADSDVSADADGVPWDPDAEMAAPAVTSARPLCAYEMNPQASDDRPWGSLQPGSLEITLLDEEYELVKGFDYVNLWPAGAGEPVRYVYKRTLAQYNLDTVGVWVLECRTGDEV